MSLHLVNYLIPDWFNLAGLLATANHIDVNVSQVVCGVHHSIAASVAAFDCGCDFSRQTDGGAFIYAGNGSGASALHFIVTAGVGQHGHGVGHHRRGEPLVECQFDAHGLPTVALGFPTRGYCLINIHQLPDKK